MSRGAGRKGPTSVVIDVRPRLLAHTLAVALRAVGEFEVVVAGAPTTTAGRYDVAVVTGTVGTAAADVVVRLSEGPRDAGAVDDLHGLVAEINRARAQL